MSEFSNGKEIKPISIMILDGGKGQRPATGIFIYTHSKDQIQKNHNKEALKLLEVKKSQATIEQQAIGSAFIPTHKFKANFLEYYEEYVKLNTRKGNRHLINSLAQFKLFINKNFISPIDITGNLCKRFWQYQLDKYNGLTHLYYFHLIVNLLYSYDGSAWNPRKKKDRLNRGPFLILYNFFSLL